MHPMDDNLVGYLLSALDDESRRGVEGYLRSDPGARRKLARLRQVLQPLEADRAAPEPPGGLALATLDRIAEAGPRTLPLAPRVSPAQAVGRGWWRRPDVLVAAALLLIVGGVVFAWLSGTRQRSDIVACQANLHRLHTSLVNYADLHDEAFPCVEADGARSFAGVYAPLLADAGLLGPGVSVTCPGEGPRSASQEPGQVRKLEGLFAASRPDYDRAARELGGSYAYSLGYRDGNGLCGLRKDSGDLLPILADRPPADPDGPDNSGSHGGRGQNVLTIGGSVRYVKSRRVGLNGDDIYVNLDQRVGAGLTSADTVLAASDASP